ncbi:O-antigen ligase family protein [Jejudonia soesokkakensis]|uniref:O-antigen ligase family protein n=1 Tax=Jejudonia soesokkakensis TaxID=1323432 RepID=A0ABW2MN19_9FLAO
MRILLASIYPYAFFLLLLLIPFDGYVRILPNILIAIIVVAFPFVFKKTDFKKLVKLPTLLFFGLIFFLGLNTLLLGRFEDNSTVLLKILASGALLILYLPIKDFKKVYHAIIFSALLAMIISGINILMVVKETGAFDIWNPLNPLDTLLIERLYLGFLCVLSILASYQCMSATYKAENKYYLANIVLTIGFTFLIVSRYAILVLILLAILRLLYGKAKIIRVIVTLVIIGVVSTLAFIFNENIRKRFLYITPDTTVNEPLLKKTKGAEPRTIIWECAATILEKEQVLVKGIGFETTKNELLACYTTSISDDNRREKFLNRKYNSHNQFLDFYLSAGAIAVVLFITLFLVLFVLKRKDYFSTALLVTIVLFGLIENFFHRQMGAYYFGIIIILLLIQNSTYIEKKGHSEQLKS